MLNTFNEFVNENNQDDELEFDKPVTIGELKAKLDLVTREFDVTDDDYVFFTLPGTDEGVIENHIPVTGICGDHIHLVKGQEKRLETIFNKEGVNLCFFVKGTR